jgi:hypothetical protein
MKDILGNVPSSVVTVSWVRGKGEQHAVFSFWGRSVPSFII